MIIIINNGGQYVHRIYRTLKYTGSDSKIVPNSISVNDIIDENPTGIILSGGPYSVNSDEDKLGNYREIIDHCIESGMPLLGICLGHQAIAKYMGGEVKGSDFAGYAKIKIKLKHVKGEGDLFHGIGNEIHVWESHKDEVVKLPGNFISIAGSDICEIEAMMHSEKPVYGVQFHPEVEHTDNGKDIIKNFTGICAGTR